MNPLLMILAEVRNKRSELAELVPNEENPVETLSAYPIQVALIKGLDITRISSL